MRHALVIGLGASGLFASRLLTRRGWNVTAVGRGTPVSALSTGCVKRQCMGGECLEEFEGLFRNSGMPMAEGTRTGVTGLGTRYDCAMSPPHSTWAEEDGPRSVTVMGIGRHPSLRPGLAVSALATWGPKARAQTFDLELPAESSLAAAFREEERREGLVEAMKDAWGESVLLPPLFSLSDYPLMERMERRSGRRLLEAITPLGTPGQRFLEVLETGAREAGVQLWYGRKVISLEVNGDQVTNAEVQGGLESRKVDLDVVLLAGGGPLTDGLLLRSTALEDPFGLFRTDPGDGSLGGGYAHQGNRLMDRSGKMMMNAFGAGDCLLSPSRGPGAGLGEALSSAWTAVKAMEVL